MSRVTCFCLVFAIFAVRDTFEFGLNPITFIKNWSLKGSNSFPMPKDFMDTRQLISREEYDWKSYRVMSNDGYILQLTRIIPRQPTAERRAPIMMVHGVFATSETWVLRGRSRDLSFQLAEMGYDVWLVDLRGNYFSKSHKYLSPGNPRFWDFSFHEIGAYDLPAIVDFILGETGARQVGYIGHSMGTTVFLAFASLHPEYNEKIGAAVLLAPVASKFPFEEIYNPTMRLALTQFNLIYDTFASAGIYEILPRTPRLVYNVKKLCSRLPEQDYCLDFIGQLYGENRANLDRKHIGDQLDHIVAGASIKTLHHLAQVFHYGFNMYDFGPKKNRLKYNSTVPPSYPLDLIMVPILLLTGENDPLTSIQGSNFLANSIPGVQSKIVLDHKFSHSDFVLGQNTNKTIHRDVFDFFAQHL